MRMIMKNIKILFEIKTNRYNWVVKCNDAVMGRFKDYELAYKLQSNLRGLKHD